LISIVVTPSATSASEARRALLGQCVLRRGTRGAKRRLNAAAGAGDVGIARPVQTLFEFLRTIAGIDEMRVAIDQTRRPPIFRRTQCGAWRRRYVAARARGRSKQSDPRERRWRRRE
jgi:hypothetical protein